MIGIAIMIATNAVSRQNSVCLDGNVTPEKARKSRQMQFRDKTAYVWGLRYRGSRIPGSPTLCHPALTYSCILWHILAYSCIIWHTLTYSGLLWHTIAYSGILSGILWHILAYSGILWHTLAYSGLLWHTIAYSGILWH